MNPVTVRTVFRTLAIAEAASWALLLVAMFFKWILDAEPLGLHEGGVPVAGPIHGVVFALYVLAAVLSAFVFKWSPKVTLLALAASIPPLFTIWFEKWADGKGLLAAKDQSGATSTP